MDTPSVVIKVKYGDSLRRFIVQIVDEELDLNMGGLKKKIISLFSFSPESEIVLTYIDDDGDIVTLADDEDLQDVVKQALNPVRITVKLDSGKNNRHFNRSSGNSTPLRSPRVQQSSQNLNSDVPETLRTLGVLFTDLASKALSSDPGTDEQKPLHNWNSVLSQTLRTVKKPLRETAIKLSTDLSTKASASAPAVAELLELVYKLGLSYHGQISDSEPKVQPSTQNTVPDSITTVTETNDLGKSKVGSTETLKAKGTSEEQSLKSSEGLIKPQPEATPVNNEAKLEKKASSSEAPGFNALTSAPAVGSKIVTVGKKEKIKKDKSKKLSEYCSTEKSHMTRPVSGPKIADISAPNLLKGDSLDGRTKSVSFGDIGNALGPGNGSLNSLGSGYGPGYLSEYPVSGIPVSNINGLRALPVRQNDSSGIVFHTAVRCDGCGVHPITGPRFKSKVKVDYDLCSLCFSKMGNETDYIKMDLPEVYLPRIPVTGLYGYAGAPYLPQVCRGSKVKSSAIKLDSCFIQDINIVDGTIMAPLTSFTKIWRMRNNGTVAWPQKTQLVWIGGDRLSHAFSVEVEVTAAGLLVDQELDVAVDFVAPQLPGKYVSYWRIASPSGQKFGQRIWVLIQVDASAKETQRGNVRGFNLNLPPPPVSIINAASGPEIINVGPELMVEDAVSSSKTVNIMHPPNIEHEMKFPINDSLLVGSGAWSISVPSSAAAVTYPVVNRSPVVTSAFSPIGTPIMLSHPPPHPPAFVANSQETAVNEIPPPNNIEEEKMLLKELAEMGFNQVDLNREILRRNKYNFELTVDDLCDIAQWD